ncbi:hypothetical protein [Streptomyces turgidiscabies]|uniref:Uncharacterized protein n=1 Tax=Streptomyces turgidiscabies TaxID=85558 RepID=A0ABU0RRY8_9ACTN|nr:hypothetical protein [Streptomyces turgidiscabies]MDQ0934483.1 hypothetical protein [Streptomyces turgidiscabies]
MLNTTYRPCSQNVGSSYDALERTLVAHGRVMGAVLPVTRPVTSWLHPATRRLPSGAQFGV